MRHIGLAQLLPCPPSAGESAGSRPEAVPLLLEHNHEDGQLVSVGEDDLLLMSMMALLTRRRTSRRTPTGRPGSERLPLSPTDLLADVELLALDLERHIRQDVQLRELDSRIGPIPDFLRNSLAPTTSLMFSSPR